MLIKLYQAGLELAGFVLHNVVELCQGVLVDLASLLSSGELNISLSSCYVEVGGGLSSVTSFNVLGSDWSSSGNSSA